MYACLYYGSESNGNNVRDHYILKVKVKSLPTGQQAGNHGQGQVLGNRAFACVICDH